MEATTTANTLLEKINGREDTYIGVHDYEIVFPVVDENFDQIDDGEQGDIEGIAEIINREEMKTLIIEVFSLDMIPTAVMFCMRNHRFTRKHIYLSSTLPGWEILYSFFLSSSAEKVFLIS